MAGNKTFTMIKPSAAKDQHTGPIINMIENAGFRLVALKRTIITPDEASAFYHEHYGKPFFEGLVSYMSSGPVIAMILEKENAVEDFRKLIGATNPEAAEEGTIRKLYGTSVQQNAIHGSDCDDSAERESNFFFSMLERI